MEVERPVPGGLGLATRVIPMSFPEADIEAARVAFEEELGSITGINVFDPSKVYDLAVVRAQNPTALLGTA